MKATVEFRAEIHIEIPDDLVDRVIGPPVRNEDEHGVPQPYDPHDRDSRGWRNVLYNLDTAEKVIEHLAYNAAVNGVEDVRRLDGWANISEDDARRIQFSRVDVLDTDAFITEGIDALSRYGRQS